VVDLAQRNSNAVRTASADIGKAQAAHDQAKDVLIPSLLVTTGIPAFPEVGFTGSPPTLWGATVQSLVYGIPQKNYISSAQSGVLAATFALKGTRTGCSMHLRRTSNWIPSLVNSMQRQQETCAARLVEITQQRWKPASIPSASSPRPASRRQPQLARLHLGRVPAISPSNSRTHRPAVGSSPPTPPAFRKFRSSAACKPLYRQRGGCACAANARLAYAKGRSRPQHLPPIEFLRPVQPQYHAVERCEFVLRQASADQ
jgi:hypothetical protein